MNTIKIIKELKSDVNTSTSLTDQAKKEVLNVIEQVEAKIPTDNPKIFMTVIILVGVAMVASIVIGGILALKEPTEAGTVEIPDFIIMLGSTSLGALAGLLAPTPGRE
ncbi:MAG: hypothetical protein AAFZ15_00180 [Bacteroidota bacterium]